MYIHSIDPEECRRNYPLYGTTRLRKSNLEIIITLMMGQQAEAQRREGDVVGAPQSNRAASQEGVVNAQVGVNANVQTGRICVQALASDTEC